MPGRQARGGTPRGLPGGCAGLCLQSPVRPALAAANAQAVGQDGDQDGGQGGDTGRSARLATNKIHNRARGRSARPQRAPSNHPARLGVQGNESLHVSPEDAMAKGSRAVTASLGRPCRWTRTSRWRLFWRSKMWSQQVLLGRTMSLPPPPGPEARRPVEEPSEDSGARSLRPRASPCAPPSDHIIRARKVISLGA